MNKTQLVANWQQLSGYILYKLLTIDHEVNILHNLQLWDLLVPKVVRPWLDQTDQFQCLVKSVIYVNSL